MYMFTYICMSMKYIYISYIIGYKYIQYIYLVTIYLITVLSLVQSSKRILSRK